MNSRDFLVLAIAEYAVVLGILVYVLAAWILSLRDREARAEESPAPEPFAQEAQPQQRFMVWINSLPRLGEDPPAPLRSLRSDGSSIQVQD